MREVIHKNQFIHFTLNLEKFLKFHCVMWGLKSQEKSRFCVTLLYFVRTPKIREKLTGIVSQDRFYWRSLNFKCYFCTWADCLKMFYTRFCWKLNTFSRKLVTSFIDKFRTSICDPNTLTVNRLWLISWSFFKTVFFHRKGAGDTDFVLNIKAVLFFLK